MNSAHNVDTKFGGLVLHCEFKLVEYSLNLLFVKTVGEHTPKFVHNSLLDLGQVGIRDTIQAKRKGTLGGMRVVASVGGEVRSESRLHQGAIHW